MNKIKAFLLGIREFWRTYTWADPNRVDWEYYKELDITYDCGRKWAHRLTFRHFEN